MLEISDVKVYDLEECLIASGNAMRTEPEDYSEEAVTKGLKRGKKLVLSSLKTNIGCHDNFLTGIRVSFNIKYPQYWTPEFQRYHFADIVTSSSKMHRLCKMDIKKSCNKYVTDETIENLEKYISEYNMVSNEQLPWIITPEYLEDNRDRVYKAFMKVISNCPMGLELFMRVSTNYKQLQTIYRQRHEHKLKEDWGAFCKMIEELPYAKDFLINDDISTGN